MQGILRRRRGFGNPPHRLHTRPVEPVKQGGELHRGQAHYPVHHRRPAEGTLLQLLPDQDQTAVVPDQDLHPVRPLGAEDAHRARERILAQHLGGQRRQPMRALAEVHRPGRDQDPRTGGKGDHDRDAEARTARNTVVSKPASIPAATRTTAPASRTSTAGAAAPSGATGDATGAVSMTSGTKRGEGSSVDAAARRAPPSRSAWRRQPNNCCGQSCQRRATSETVAPGRSVSATARAFSSADQRRRRPGPVNTSMRRNPAFASSFASYIRIARSSVPPGIQAPHRYRQNKGGPAPLTDNLTPVAAMAHRLKTPEGRKLYALRKHTPEPVFGIIKSALGFRQFLLRGLDNVRGEWNLVTMVYNVKRLFTLAAAA